MTEEAPRAGAFAMPTVHRVRFRGHVVIASAVVIVAAVKAIFTRYSFGTIAAFRPLLTATLALTKTVIAELPVVRVVELGGSFGAEGGERPNRVQNNFNYLHKNIITII